MSGRIGGTHQVQVCYPSCFRSMVFSRAFFSPLSSRALGSHASALPHFQYERRLDRRRDDKKREHNRDVPPEGMLYIDSKKCVSLAPNPTDDRHAGHRPYEVRIRNFFHPAASPD